MLDDSVLQPACQVFTWQGSSHPNPTYSYWLQVDQFIHAWLFATIFNNNINEVRDLQHSLLVWQRLESRFSGASLVRALNLKRTLTNVIMGTEQSMDAYLHSIKTIADALVVIQSSVFNLKLI